MWRRNQSHKPSTIASSNAGIQGDIQAAGRIEAYLSLPKPGQHDDRESLFTYDFKPKVAFAQDWCEVAFANVQYGMDVNQLMPKFADIFHQSYLHTTLRGIIGVQHPTEVQTSYPFLVSANDCGVNQDGLRFTNCVPVQERFLAEFENDAGTPEPARRPQDIEDAQTAYDTAQNTYYLAVRTFTKLTDAVANATVAGADLTAKNTALEAMRDAETAYLAAATVHRARLNQSELGALTLKPFVHYTQGSGFRVMEEFELTHGTSPCDLLDHRFVQIFEELHGGYKRLTTDAGVQKTREDLVKASLYDQDLYIAIPLWFTHFIGIAFHMVKAQLTNSMIRVKIARKEELVVCSDNRTSPWTTKKRAPPVGDEFDWAYDTQDTSIHDRVADAPLSDTDIAMSMLYQIFYLEEAERDHHIEIASNTTEYSAEAQVMTRTHHQRVNVAKGNLEEKIHVDAQEAVFEIILVAQLKSNRDSNNWYNYSRVGPDFGGTGGAPPAEKKHEVRIDQANADIITSIGVKVNDQQRFTNASSMVYRTVIPHAVHSSMPDLYAGHYIYSICMSAFPEDITTYAGSINASRVANIDIDVFLHESCANENVTIDLYYRTWTLFTSFQNVAGRTAAH